MKHVRESLSQYEDYQFFKNLRTFEDFEPEEKTDEKDEEKDDEEDEDKDDEKEETEEKEDKPGTPDKKDKSTLQDKEKDGLAVIEKLKKNFEDFKNGAKGEITQYKEFWEENKKTKEGFAEEGEGDVYKLYDSDYVVGVLTLPVSTLSDGSIDGGMGATDEPVEEIIEGKEIQPAGNIEPEAEPQENFFEEKMVPNPANEAVEPDDDGLPLEGSEDTTDDLGLDTNVSEPGAEPADDGLPIEGADDLGTDDSGLPAEGTPEETPLETPETTPEMPAESPEMSEPTADLNAPQKYFVVYDTAGDEREEILRTGSSNVVSAFTSFYNDTFKGGMKNAIIKYKETKELQKKEVEKTEKSKVETDKSSKIKKFLGESQRDYLNAVHAVKNLNEWLVEDKQIDDDDSEGESYPSPEDSEGESYPRSEDGNISQYENWIINELIDAGSTEDEAIDLLAKHRDIVSSCFTLDGDAEECAMNILDAENVE